MVTARPGRALPPGKTRYPLYRRLDGPQGRSGRAENLAPSGFDARTALSIVSRKKKKTGLYPYNDQHLSHIGQLILTP